MPITLEEAVERAIVAREILQECLVRYTVEQYKQELVERRTTGIVPILYKEVK